MHNACFHQYFFLYLFKQKIETMEHNIITSWGAIGLIICFVYQNKFKIKNEGNSIISSFFFFLGACCITVLWPVALYAIIKK